MRFILAATTWVGLFINSSFSAQERPASSSDSQFGVIADRYHTLFLRQPRRGATLDMLVRHYLDAGRLDDLIAHLEQHAQQQPNEAAAQLALGLVYERRGQDSNAMRAFERASELAPQDYYPPYCLALLLAERRNDQQAIDAFQEALARGPSRTELLDIHTKLGRLHARQGNADQAIKVWSELAHLFPGDRLVLEELADLLAEEEQFEEAIRRYTEITQLSEGDPYKRIAARVEIGQIMVRQGKLQSAVKEFDECLAGVDADSWLAADIRRRVEEVFVRSNDLAGLAAYYRDRLQRNPEELSSVVRLAATTARMGDREAALQQYRVAIKLAPRRRDLREALIDELVRAENYREAMAECDLLVRQHPADVQYLRQLGELHIKAAAGEERSEFERRAIEVWKRIAAIRPDDAGLALQAAELCRRAAAIEDRVSDAAAPAKRAAPESPALANASLDLFREAVRRAPGVPQYSEYLGNFLFALGREGEALSVWRQIAEPPQDSVENLKRLAQLFSGAGKLDAAVETVRRAIEKTDDRYDLHALAVELLVKQREFDAALSEIAHMERLADTPLLEERSLARRVEVYAAAGRLPDESAKLADRLRSPDASLREVWLAAMISAADRRWSDTVAYLDRGIALQSNDPRLLRLKARAHQNAGDLAGAAEQFQQLAKLDIRNRTEYVKELVRLQLELGRGDAAKTQAEELIRLSPANVDGYTLLAEIQFRLRQVGPALDALRRAVRIDPRNIEIRLTLARSLAHHNRSDEAIEHFWRAFELSADPSSKVALAGTLANVYATESRLTQLIDRFLRLKRDQEDPYVITLCLIEAYLHAEDYNSVRRELTSLLAHRPNDPQVLSMLVTFAERMRDYGEAVEYQRKLASAVPDPGHLERLAKLLEGAGRKPEAQEIWTQIARGAKDEFALLAAMDRAAEQQDSALVIRLGGPKWSESPDDWRYGLRIAMAHWVLKEYSEARSICESIQRLSPSDRFNQQSVATPTNPAQTANRLTPPSLGSVGYPAEFAWLDSASQARVWLQQSERNVRLARFGFPGNSRGAQAIATVILHDVARRENRDKEWLAELQARAEQETESLRQLACIYHLEQKRTELDALVNVWLEKQPNDAVARVLQFQALSRTPPMPGDAAAEQKLAMVRDSFDWMANNRPDLARWFATSYAHSLIAWGPKSDARQFLSHQIAQAADLDELGRLVTVAAQLQDLEISETLLARAEELDRLGSRSAVHFALPRILEMFARQAVASKQVALLLAALDRQMQATHPSVIRTGITISTVTASSGPRILSPSTRFARTRGNLARLGQFPSSSSYLEGSRFQLLATVYQNLKGSNSLEPLIELIERRIHEAEQPARQCWQVARACIAWWEDDRATALKQLADVAAVFPNDAGIALMRARAHVAENELKESLAALESVFVPFGPSAKVIEDARLQLALAQSNDEVAQQAALRLFGMRLAPNEQVELAGVLRRLGLGARSEELMQRAERAAAASPADLLTLMRQYAQTNNPKASAVARQVLQQSSRTNRPNINANQQRLEALQVLRQAGELDPMIAHAESQLHAAPESIKLLEDLAELYTAVGNESKLTAIYDRISVIRPDDPNVQFQIALSQLERRQFDDAFRRLDLVWEKDPQTMLQQGQIISRYYAQAGRLNKLTEQVAKLKNHPALPQNAFGLGNMVRVLDQIASIDELAKLYRVIIEVSPQPYQASAVSNYASFLQSKGRRPEAFELYRDLVLPTTDLPAGRDERSIRTSAYFQQLIDLAKQVGRMEELGAQLRAAGERHPTWNSTAELLISMLDRRRGDETSMAGFARRYLDDTEFAKSLGTDLTAILAEEIAHCGTKSALECAAVIWEARLVPPSATRSASAMSSEARTRQRLASIWFRLGDREKAREHLLAALKPSSAAPESNPSSMFLSRSFGDRKPLIDALREYGFRLEAIGHYDALLEMDYSQEQMHSHTFPLSAAVRRALSECISTVLNTPGFRDEALDRLAVELAKTDSAPDLAIFFATNDPLADRERERSSSGTISQAVVMPSAIRPQPIAQLPQLLPGLLSHARDTGRFEALLRSARESASRRPNDLQVVALAAMIVMAGDKPEDAVPTLERLFELSKPRKDWSASSEVWLVAQTAIVHTATRDAGRRLVELVATSHGIRGNVGRQQAALATFATLLADSPDSNELRTTLERVLAERKDPETRLHIASLYFHQNKFSDGVALLEQIWNRDPDLLLPKLGELVGYYAAAGKMDDLVKSLMAIRDESVRRQCSYQIANLAQSLATHPSQWVNALKFHRAALEFAPTSQQGYEAGQVSSLLSQAPLRPDVYEAIRRIALPARDDPGRFSEFARPAVELATKLGRLDELEVHCRQAIEQHTSWKPHGQLMLAMIARRRGDTTPMEEVARRLRDDSTFARTVPVLAPILRDELTACDSRSATELALQLWQEHAAAQRNVDTRTTSQIAGLWIKLGERIKAREALLAALHYPDRSLGLLDARFQIQRDMQRRYAIAELLVTHGFRVDAVAVCETIVATNVSSAPADDYVHHVLRQAHELGQQAIRHMIATELDEVVQSLATALRGDSKARSESGPKAAPDLAGFFVTFEPRHELIPRIGATAGSKPAAGQLLGPLLTHARKTGSIDGLTDAAEQALQEFPDNLPLTALTAIIAFGRDNPDQARDAVWAVAESVRTNPELGSQTAVWHLARVAMEHAATRPLGQQLAEAVVLSAGRSNNTARQMAAFRELITSYMTSGNSEASTAIVPRLMVSTGDDAPSQVQLAHLLLGHDETAQGLAALARAWKKDTRWMISRVGELYPLYSKAGHTKSLCDELRAVQDSELRRELSMRLNSVANSIMHAKGRDEDIYEFLQATLAIATEESNRENALSLLSKFLSDRKRTAEAMEVLQRSVLPPNGRSDRLSGLVQRLADYAKELNKLDDLETACRQASAETPGWSEHGELLLAMIERRRGDESRFERIAVRLRTEPAYATALETAQSMITIRSELSQCGLRSCLETALDLWQQEIQRVHTRYSTDSTAHEQSAQIAVKLGDRERALQSWFASIEATSPNIPPDHQIHEKVSRRQRVAQQMQSHGFRMDALRLYTMNHHVAIPLHDRHGISARLRQQRDPQRTLFREVIASGLDEALASLESEIGSERRPPDLSVFFVVIHESWSQRERAQVSASAVERSKDSEDMQLLPATIDRARVKGRLETLAAAVSNARLRFPDHIELKALELMVQLKNGRKETVQTLGKAWIDRFAESPEIAGRPETLLIAQAMLNGEATVTFGATLVEAAISQAAKGDSIESLAALFELAGQTAAAQSLRRQFSSEFERVLVWHREQAALAERARDWPSAHRHLHKLIEAEPQSTHLRLRCAAAVAALGDRDLATRHYDAARKLETGLRPALAIGGRSLSYSAPNIPFEKFESFTMECWVAGWHGPIVCQGLAGDPENSVWISLGPKGATNPHESIGWESDGGQNIEVAIGDELEATWHHIALVFDGQQQLIFLDGKIQRSTFSPPPGPLDVRRGLIIGAHCYGDDRAKWHFGSGLFGSLRVSRIARYAADFEPAKSLPADESTILLYDVNELADSDLRDKSGNQRDATKTVIGTIE